MSDFGVLALTVFLASVGGGVFVHEGAHGAVLRRYGYRHRYSFGLGDDDGFVARLAGANASVEWRPFEERARGVELAFASLAPLAVCLPAMAVLELGYAPGLARFVLAGVVFTTIPSPADFGVAWRGLRGWDDHLARALDAVANHEAAEGYDPTL